MPTMTNEGVSHRMRPDSVWVSLNQHPLGEMANENFGVPSNYRIPSARIYVVNHSRTRKWRRTVAAVSDLRGADDALMLDKELKNLYNADMLYKQVEKGRDMNRYKDEIKAVVWEVDIPGSRYRMEEVPTPDGKVAYQKQWITGSKILVPPSHPDTPDKKIMVEVPEGTWDLYMGNYDRMRGYAGLKPRSEERFSNQVKMLEEQALALRWRRRHNPVFAFTDDGVTTDLSNPFGVLEFVRVTQRATNEPIDKDYLSAIDIFEVA